MATLAQLQWVPVSLPEPQMNHVASPSDAAHGAGSGTPVLLYDGDCGLCARSVQFVLAHETSQHARILQFAPLQGSFGASTAATFPAIITANSVVWLERANGIAPRILIRSDAALAVLTYLSGGWGVLAVLGRLVPRVLRDAVYSAIATHRLSIAAAACMLPTAEERARFLA